MSKSIVSAVVIPAKGNKAESTLFGILDASTPFRVSKDGEQYANGLAFGETKARLLLDRLIEDPAQLRTDLEMYLECYGTSGAIAEHVKASTAAAPTPTPSPVVATLQAPAIQAPAPAPAPVIQAPAPTAPASPPKPAPAPSPEVAYKGRRYRRLVDGTVQFYQDDRADGKDRWVKYTGPLVFAFGPKNATPPAPAMPLPAAPKVAPAPAPSPVKLEQPILRDVVDGETIIRLYVDGTYRLFNMASV